MKKYILLGISILIILNNVYSFSQTISPTESTLLEGDEILSITISGIDNVSSFVNWNNSIIGYWNFENYNSTHIINSISTRDGIFRNNFNVNNSNPIRGNYGEFDGFNDSIEIPKYDFRGKNFSISAWINPKNLVNDQGVIVSKWGVDIAGIEFLFRTQIDGSLQLYTGTGNFWKRTGAGVINLNQWQHVVVVYNEQTNNAAFYVNTIKLTNSQSNGPLDKITNYYDYPITIGKQYTQNDPFNGSIDEVLIYNRKISTSEINALYNSQLNNFNISLSNLNRSQIYPVTYFSINTSGDIIKSNYIYNVPQIEKVSSIFPIGNMLFGIFIVLYFLIS